MNLKKIVICIGFLGFLLPSFAMTCNEINDQKIKVDLRNLIFKDITDIGLICTKHKTCATTELNELKPYWDDFFANQLIKKYSEFIDILLESESKGKLDIHQFKSVDCRFQVHVGFGFTRPILESDPNIFKYGLSIPYSLNTDLIETEAWRYINYAGCRSQLTTDCSGVMMFAHGFARYALLKRLPFARQMLTDIENPTIEMKSDYLNYFRNDLFEKKIVIFEVTAFAKILENRLSGKPSYEGIEMKGPLTHTPPVLMQAPPPIIAPPPPRYPR